MIRTNNKAKRIKAGRYVCTTAAGKRYLVAEVGLSEGFAEARWVISPESGATGACRSETLADIRWEAPCDAAETLREAKDMIAAW